MNNIPTEDGLEELKKILGDKKDGPFCYRCWHETGTLIRMNPCGDSGQSECMRCNSREHTGL